MVEKSAKKYFRVKTRVISKPLKSYLVGHRVKLSVVHLQLIRLLAIELRLSHLSAKSRAFSLQKQFLTAGIIKTDTRTFIINTDTQTHCKESALKFVKLKIANNRK